MIQFRGAWALAPAALAGAALTLVHAALLRTDPVADALLEEAPAAVRLWFSEEVRAAPDPVEVIDPQGRRVDSGAGVAPDDRTELRATVSDGGPGTYTVRWRALSEDGHVIEGGYNYSVQTTSEPAAAVQVAANDGAARVLVLGRGLHLVGLSLALGALALGLLIGPGALATAAPLVRAGRLGAMLVVLAAPVLLFGQAAAAAGSLSGGVTGPALGAVFATPWGTWWIARLVAGVALAGVAFGVAAGRTPGRGLLGAAAASSVLLLVATSANGHALATDPVWLSVFLDAVHLAATAAWLGGGVCLALLVRAGRGGSVGSSRVDLQACKLEYSIVSPK